MTTGSEGVERLVEHMGLVMTPWQKKLVEQMMEEASAADEAMRGVSPHSYGRAIDVHYNSPRSGGKMERFVQMYGRAHMGRTWGWDLSGPREISGVIINGAEVRVTVPSNGRYSIGRNIYYGTVVFELYDHVVKFYEPSTFGFSNRSKPRVECDCGWKNTGDDCGTRAEAHIRKMREWLDEHPEEESMAGFGGKISWPKKQPQPRKKKNFKNKRRRR